MQKRMKTAGDMRDFLLEMMEGVRNGSVELQRASTVAKLAGQVTASLCAEAQMALVADKTRREFGSALLGAPDVEANAEARQIQAPKQAEIALPAGKDEPVWCGQCEERVRPSRAQSCKSPFCKVITSDAA